MDDPLTELPPPTPEEFKRFRIDVLVQLGVCIGLVILVLSMFSDGSLSVIGLILALSIFPGYTAIRLALGGYETFRHKAPKVVKQRREQARTQPSSVEVVQRWSAFTKILLILFCGGMSAMTAAVSLWVFKDSPVPFSFTVVMLLLSAVGIGAFALFVIWCWISEPGELRWWASRK